MFFYEFCEVSRNTFFIENLLWLLLAVETLKDSPTSLIFEIKLQLKALSTHYDRSHTLSQVTSLVEISTISSDSNLIQYIIRKKTDVDKKRDGPR